MKQTKIIFLLGAMLLFVACDKNATNICSKQVKPKSNHLISVQKLAEMGDKVALIESKGELQITSFETINIPNTEESTVAKCNQFFNGLPIFTSTVNFIFSSKNGVYINATIIDSINKPFDVTLNHEQATQIAHERIKSKTCYDAVLGFYDVNAGKSKMPINHKLVWKVTPSKAELPYAIIDASSGEVIAFTDGMIICFE